MRADRGRRLALATLALFPLLASTSRDAKRLLLFSPSDSRAVRENLRLVAKALAARGWKAGPRLAVTELAPRDDSQDIDQLARIAVGQRPDVIVTEGTYATSALLRATSTIAVVATVSDPVGSGFAKSLASPGRNFTGLAQGGREAAAKLAELVAELVPGIRRVGLIDPPEPPMKRIAAFYAAAFREKGIAAAWFEPREQATPKDLMTELRAKGAQAVYLGEVDDEYADRLSREGLRQRMPLFAKSERGVEAGMLASVDNDPSADFDRQAGLVERILEGTPAGHLPIQFPDRFRTVVNRRTAEALGLRVPPAVLLRADRVVE